MISPAAIPAEIRALCKTLRAAGHPAFVVGGAVRDLIRGVPAKDFDVTTAARPEVVLELFGKHRTVPTGLQHGTVTVLCDQLDGDGRPLDRRRHPPLPVEVTTYRGETAYSDGRRPDQVAFIDDLTEDLRRRDFTINAIAYDPVEDRLEDPFGGVADLRARLLRAVGDPVARFGEDGLRVMRAVRFAAQLEFTVEPPTRAAFAGALPTLRKVSRERVRDELQKLLSAKRPAVGLELMCEAASPAPSSDAAEPAVPIVPVEDTVLCVAFPEVAAALGGRLPQLRRFYALVEKTQGAARRLGAFLWPLRDGGLDLRALSDLLDERLKLPSKQRDHLAALLTLPLIDPAAIPSLTGPVIRRLLARHPAELLDDLLALQRAAAQLGAGGTGEPDPDAAAAIAALEDRVAHERSQRPPLSIGELALSGKDVVAALGRPPGPWVGELLRGLLDAVLEDPARNTRDALLARARELAGA